MNLDIVSLILTSDTVNRGVVGSSPSMSAMPWVAILTIILTEMIKFGILVFYLWLLKYCN